MRRMLAMFVAALTANVLLGAPVAAAKAGGGAARAAEVRAGVERLGVGEGARVEVRMRDRRKLKGYVSEAGADHFVVRDARTGAATAVAYPEVSQVKGHNLSTGAKVAVGAGLAAAAVILFIMWASQFE